MGGIPGKPCRRRPLVAGTKSHLGSLLGNLSRLMRLIREPDEPVFPMSIYTSRMLLCSWTPRSSIATPAQFQVADSIKLSFIYSDYWYLKTIPPHSTIDTICYQLVDPRNSRWGERCPPSGCKATGLMQAKKLCSPCSLSLARREFELRDIVPNLQIIELGTVFPLL
jgi:hypothetical protein